jgi:DNA-binding transcriptional regulator YhcF (GntR family)
MTAPQVPLVRIAADATTPPYEQVRAQIAEAAARGDLPAGTRLPPVRTLAAELGLAAATVARAYRELEQAGVVETRGRAGTVVTGGGDAARAEGARLAARFAAATRALGLRPEEAVAMVQAAFRG